MRIDQQSLLSVTLLLKNSLSKEKLSRKEMSSSSTTGEPASNSVPLVLKKAPHVSLQEAIESQQGVSGMLIADQNGLLISSKGDLTGNDVISSRKMAGHLAQVVKTALTLSDSGAEKVTVVIETSPSPYYNSNGTKNNGGNSPKPSSVNNNQHVTEKQIVVTKTNDYFVAVATKSN